MGCGWGGGTIHPSLLYSSNQKTKAASPSLPRPSTREKWRKPSCTWNPKTCDSDVRVEETCQDTIQDVDVEREESVGDVSAKEPADQNDDDDDGAVELHKQLWCTLRLSNQGGEDVAFKVKTTAPRRYCVRPNASVIKPGTTVDVNIMMLPQKEQPQDLQNCKDKFLIQYLNLDGEELTPDTFSKGKNKPMEKKLKVYYTGAVPTPPVLEGDELNDSTDDAPPAEAKAMETPEDMHGNYETLLASLTKATEEKNAERAERKRLEAELASLREGGKAIGTLQDGGSYSVLHILIAALLALVLGLYFR